MRRWVSLKYPANPVAGFWIGCIVLALVKLILVSNEEIVARYQPLDDLWNVMAAARGYWFGTGRDVITYVRPPAYPVWIAVAYFTRIPLRLATELLFLAAAFAFVLAIV